MGGADLCGKLGTVHLCNPKTPSLAGLTKTDGVFFRGTWALERRLTLKPA